MTAVSSVIDRARDRIAEGGGWRAYGLPIVLLLIVLIGSITSRYFLIDFSEGITIRWGNVLTILVQASVTGILAVGMTYVILTGGIDLSVGSIVALAGVAAASFLDFGAGVMVAAGLLQGSALASSTEPSSHAVAWCRSSRRWPC